MRARTAYHVKTAAALLRTGILRPTRVDRALRSLDVLRRWGLSMASGATTAAIRYPDRAAVIDEWGTLTFSELAGRTNALTNALAARGVSEGDGIAVMCRNHRGFIETTLACAKLGADALYLNTEFGAPAIAAVLEREAPAAVIYDEEFANLVTPGAGTLKRYVAAYDGDAPGETSLDALIAEGDPGSPPPPRRIARTVILTSGTTGTPKGAMRRPPETFGPAAAVLSRIPLKALGRTVIAAPMFHSWGLSHLMLGLPLSSTLVLRRRFDPEETLRAVARHRATALIVVPVMLQRMLELPPEAIARHDISSLRVIASSGSALPGELASRVMDTFGDVLYNLYGSTEVAYATIATPEELRAAPGTAGRPPLGTVLKLLDEDGREVGPGQRGRIFVGNEFVFDGYTDGRSQETIGGLMHTGDVGHFDAEGRLFVDGRDDEMIVSGGENVYPREVEDLLANHGAVEEAAVIGVDDEAFGQRLRAFVVPRNGARLDEEAVKAFVRDNLARYKVPRDVIFLPALPRNASGKILKRQLEIID